MTPFFKQIQEFTIVSNPKGDKKTPSIRICVRHFVRVFSTYYKNRFSIKMTLVSSRFKSLLSSRARRGITKTPSIRICVRHVFHVFSTSQLNPTESPGIPQIAPTNCTFDKLEKSAKIYFWRKSDYEIKLFRVFWPRV